MPSSSGSRAPLPRALPASARVVTYLTPPRLASLPHARDQLEFSSRSLVYANDGAEILRVWGPPDRPWVLGITESGERWRVTAWGASPAAARAAARAVFSLEDPLEQFYALVRRESVLRGTLRSFHGLRLPRDASLFESLVHAVLGQQLSVAAATTIKGRLVAATDAFVDVDGRAIARIPSPDELTQLGFAGLRSVGASGAKARTLLALADRYRAGAFDERRFRRGSSEQAIERLDAEPGVGRWTAENALLRGIGRRDLFVAGDLGLRVALDRFGAVPKSAPEAAARDWGDRWYPGWGSYATLYLWRKLVTERPAATPAPAPPGESAPPRGGPRRPAEGRST
jgi:3-methyladenine DNA glycosylase/8-oxoguanine DNA glycosylase